MDLRSIWRRWRGVGRAQATDPAAANAGVSDAGGRVNTLTPNHDGVALSLQELLNDPTVPPALRVELAADFARVASMLDKLQRDELHVAVFGRVSAGKSALGNALLGRQAFEVGVLHGTTTEAEPARLDEAASGGLVLIDTPGINELGGEAREALAVDVAQVSDLVVYVADGDLTRDELDALRALAATQRPIVLALNKADRYAQTEREELLAHLRSRTAGLVRPEDVIAVCALPAPLRMMTPSGLETTMPQAPDVDALRTRLLDIARRDGKALNAINAGLFAGRLADQVGQRIAASRRELASRVIRQYCLAKGVAVALNPIPVADLLAAAGLDAAMVVQLSRVYGMPLTRAESGRLVATVSAQLIALMGAIWGMQLVASALKGLSGGLSVVVTGAAQGALAWYATVLIGRAAERYLVAGKSWGEHGPKRAVAEVVAALDRDSILREAREEILRRLRRDPALP